MTSSNIENQVYLDSSSCFNKASVEFGLEKNNQIVEGENANKSEISNLIQGDNLTRNIDSALVSQVPESQNTDEPSKTLCRTTHISKSKAVPKRIVLKFSPQKTQNVNKSEKESIPVSFSKVTSVNSKNLQRPRWHTQTNIMFMALRLLPDQEASRRELITKALEIDENLHTTRKLPRAFTGKTPRNSASACLTTNPHRYFKHFYKPGIRQMFFRLTYKPCDLQAAINEYNKWMELLIVKDWPKCFEKIIPNPENYPKSWQDILEVKSSSIENAGSGLFAKQKILKGTPIGFYFGVPTMEDEYDILKDHVGMSSKYSIMYRQTVLDAVDEHGMPFTDVNGPVYCPFHFANEDLTKINITFLEGTVVNQVIVMTIKTVEANEELFVNYGPEVDRTDWTEAQKDQKLDTKSIENITGPSQDQKTPNTDNAIDEHKLTELSETEKGARDEKKSRKKPKLMDEQKEVGVHN